MKRVLLVAALACGCSSKLSYWPSPVGVSRRPFNQIPPSLAQAVSGSLGPVEQLDRARELLGVVETRIAAIKDDPDEPRKLVSDLEELSDLLPPRADLQRINDRMIDAARPLITTTSRIEREAMRDQLAAAAALLRMRLAEGYTVPGGNPR